MLIITQIQHPLRKTADNNKLDSETGRKKQQNENQQKRSFLNHVIFSNNNLLKFLSNYYILFIMKLF